MKWIKKLKDLFVKKEKERTIIVDTCALHSQETMEIIKNASKVILLTCILEEMDNHKWDKKDLGINIRKITRESRIDKNSEKYVCVAGYEKYDYNDKNIIDYCKKHRKTIIVTSDNYVCNMAKAYKIEYIFIERDTQEKTKLKKKESQKYQRQDIKNIQYKAGKLYLKENQKNMYKFFLYRENIVQNIDSFAQKELQKGDIIFMVHRRNEIIDIMQYEIISIIEHGYAICKNKVSITPLENCNTQEAFPAEVKKYILGINNKNLKKNEKLKEAENKSNKKQETSEIVSEPQDTNKDQQVVNKENSEIHFYKNGIRVNKNKEYYIKELVVRENRLIPNKYYQQGDYLYVLKYNINKKYIEIFVYEIEFENNNYKAKKIDKQRIDYINEIYKLDFSEEIENAIWKFYISNIGY